MRQKKFLDTPDEPALQLLNIRQIFRFYPVLTTGTTLPFSFVSLITSDVNVRPGKQLHNFQQDVLQERKGAVVTGAVDICDRPVRTGTYIEGTTSAGKFRIGCQRSHCVSGHLDLRYDRYLPFCSIIDYLPNFLLRVKTSIGCRLLRLTGFTFQPVNTLSVRTPGTNFGQAGIALDLYTPAIVINQVPVEGVIAIQRQQVDVLQDKLSGEKVT